MGHAFLSSPVLRHRPQTIVRSLLCLARQPLSFLDPFRSALRPAACLPGSFVPFFAFLTLPGSLPCLPLASYFAFRTPGNVCHHLPIFPCFFFFFLLYPPSWRPQVHADPVDFQTRFFPLSSFDVHAAGGKPCGPRSLGFGTGASLPPGPALIDNVRQPFFFLCCLGREDDTVSSSEVFMSQSASSLFLLPPPATSYRGRC